MLFGFCCRSLLCRDFLSRSFLYRSTLLGRSEIRYSSASCILYLVCDIDLCAA